MKKRIWTKNGFLWVSVVPLLRAEGLLRFGRSAVHHRTHTSCLHTLTFGLCPDFPAAHIKKRAFTSFQRVIPKTKTAGETFCHRFLKFAFFVFPPLLNTSLSYVYYAAFALLSKWNRWDAEIVITDDAAPKKELSRHTYTHKHWMQQILGGGIYQIFLGSVLSHSRCEENLTEAVVGECPLHKPS